MIYCVQELISLRIDIVVSPLPVLSAFAGFKGFKYDLQRGWRSGSSDSEVLGSNVVLNDKLTEDEWGL